MKDEDKQDAEGGADEEYERLWMQMYEARWASTEAALAGEQRRTALHRELEAYAHSECAFLKVKITMVDPKTGADLVGADGKPKQEWRRLWDGQTRYHATGGPEATPELVTEWVECQMSLAETAIADRARRKAIDAMEDAALFEAPDTTTFPRLTDALEADIEPTNYLIDRMLAERENAVLAAGYKAGKTTLTTDLARALATGTPFLGRPVKPLEGTVVCWDAELDLNYAVDQFRTMSMPREATDRIVYRNLKGYPLPLHTEQAFNWAVADLIEQKCEVLIIDTFGRLFTGDENSNNEVRDWLLRLDLLKRRANVQSIILVTHTGHAQEGKKTRSRGASYFGDWGGSLWSLERVSDDDTNNVRRLRIGTGRGVEAETIYYSWSPEAGVQLEEAPVSQKTEKRNDLESKVWDFVRQHPGSNIAGVVKGLGLKPGSRNTVAAILAKCVEEGSMTMEHLASSKLFSVLDIFNESD